MTFWEHFFRLLVRKPVPALAGLYWQVTRRRVRARNRLRAASVDLPFTYDLWIEANEHPAELGRDCQLAMNQWRQRPTFTIIVHSAQHASAQAVKQSIASVHRQIYAYSEIKTVGQALGEAILTSDADFVVLLQAGDVLAPTALFRFAEAVEANSGADVLYADEDRLGRHGRRSQPWFKPQWNEELFLAQDYLASAAAIRGSVARNVAEPRSDVSELLLRATAKAGGILHVPHILFHIAQDRAPPPSRVEAVARHVEQRGATCRAGPFGTAKVEWPLPDELPLVSLIVPTRDRIELLRPCLDSVLGKTDYPNFDVLVLDNESVEQSTADYLAQVSKDPRVRVLRFPGSYNFSVFNNFAARNVSGAYLCLLNNDTEVLEPAWLTEMMRYATRPEVGAVGAKLLYDDGTIQHAGVVIGLGEAAGHAHRYLPADEPGYFRMPHVAQFMSAVTAACMVVEKRKFEAVGGLDEELAVAFNDVDLCLKLEAAGWRNVYVPHAVLIHHESKSRGNDFAPEKVGRYRYELGVLQERWGTKTYLDPLHHPNLDRYSETFTVAL